MGERVRYESELDRVREERVARVVAAHLSLNRDELLTLRRCPRLYSCDWTLVDAQALEALLEVKVRQRRFGSEYMVSLHKCSEIVHMASYAQVRALLAVYWEEDNKLGVVDLLQCSRRGWHGGRIDRGDPHDMEPVILIPYRDFMEVPVTGII